MKISDITQRSQVQHIAEGRKQLDEAWLAPLMKLGASAAMKAAQAAGIIGTGVEAAKNFQAWRDGKISAKELIARSGGDLALGLGVGAAGAGVKSAIQGGRKLLGKGDNVRDLIKLRRNAERDLRQQQALLNKTKGRTDIGNSSKFRQQKIKADQRAAAAELKAANRRLRNAQGSKTKDFLNYGALGLAVPDSLDLLRDPAYKALGGVDPHGQPKAGESLADAEARRKADAKTDAQRAAERALRYKSDYITKGITTIDPQ